MKYQLVLQWPASSLKDYDLLVEIEGVLIENLDERHSIDGHDSGSGQANIFIHTDDPHSAFKEIVAVLGSMDFWIDARVAYRERNKSDYTIIWPKDLREFNVK